MTDWNYTAGTGLALYLWDEMKSELGYSETDYGGLIPIVTPHESPELQGFDGPNIVYTWSKRPQPGGLWLIENELVTFTIYSQKAEKINEIINLAFARLNKEDESGQDLNTFTSTLFGAAYADIRRFDYKSLSVLMADGPQAPLQEGGRYDGYFTVGVKYTHYGLDGLSIRY